MCSGPTPAGKLTTKAKIMNIKHYTYRVTWSPEDNEHLGLCAEFPSLSWLAKTPEGALKGIGKVVADVVADLQDSGEPVPRSDGRKALQR
jgi:predicted RNase H-like HicB family nuclease